MPQSQQKALFLDKSIKFYLYSKLIFALGIFFNCLKSKQSLNFSQKSIFIILQLIPRISKNLSFLYPNCLSLNFKIHVSSTIMHKLSILLDFVFIQSSCIFHDCLTSNKVSIKIQAELHRAA